MLRRHNIKPEIKFIHVAKHGIKFGTVAADFDIATVLRLFQRDLFEDDLLSVSRFSVSVASASFASALAV